MELKNKKIKISVIVPAYNERGNVGELVRRLAAVMKRKEWSYELIFVDDHSTDGTAELLSALKENFPIKIILKKGRRGKSFSLLEGISAAKGENICLIDADLQYPPEAIAAMVKKLEDFDIVVASRKGKSIPTIRKISSWCYRIIFGRLLLGLKADVQSGMKVFKKNVLAGLDLNPTEWGFDYEFLFKAKRKRYRIGETDIVFSPRSYGKSRISYFGTSLEIGWGTIKLRAKYLMPDILKFLDYPYASEKYPLEFQNKKDYLFLPEIFSAKKHIYWESVSLFLFFAAAAAGIIWGIETFFGIPVLAIVSGSIALFYLALIAFKTIVVYESLSKSPISFSREEIVKINGDKLPVYTILIPLYQESEVIGQIIRAMTAIDWPKDKLDIIITLENYDYETIEAIKKANPPEYFKTLILPNINPKTKPKALNVAFSRIKGEFVVVYDAEIIPDPDQLKKAYLAFAKYPHISCLQTRLDHYNANQNLITKLFNAEFSFYYDLFLPGLQRFSFPIPLSGHSTHFRRSALENIGAWDPYNVTEDCDVGIRLHRMKYRSYILDSISKEEATSSLDAWIRQRSRWMKGFLQTSIVHLRYPFHFKREIGGWNNFVAFLFIVPLTVLVNIMNLFYWILLVGWFATHSSVIQNFFPGTILYFSAFSFILGNFIFTYLNLIGSYRRGKYELVKYSLFSPIYWILLAIATTKAVVQIIARPHHWEKTKHGEHLAARGKLQVKLND